VKTSQKRRSRLMSLISAVSFWVATLLIAGLIGGIWLVRAGESAWEALVAVPALIAVVGIAWQQSRASARRRLQAAMAAYAEREIRQQRRRTARLPKNAA